MQCARHQRSRSAWHSGRVRRLARILGSGGSSGASARVFTRERSGAASDPGSHRRGNAGSCGRCLPGDRPRGHFAALTRGPVGGAELALPRRGRRGQSWDPSFDREPLAGASSRLLGTGVRATCHFGAGIRNLIKTRIARSQKVSARRRLATLRGLAFFSRNSIAAFVARTQPHNIRWKRKKKQFSGSC